MHNVANWQYGVRGGGRPKQRYRKNDITQFEHIYVVGAGKGVQRCGEGD